VFLHYKPTDDVASPTRFAAIFSKSPWRDVVGWLFLAEVALT
jgi:hypothetical protein